MSSPMMAAESKKKKSCLNCFNALLTALPSIVFGVFTILFTMSQNDMAMKNRQQDQRQADEQSIRTTFENYIEDISSLLLDENFNRSNAEHLLHIRVKTLTTLRYLDGTRRRDVVLFLYESGLLRTKRTDGKPPLQLTNANLTDVEFIGTSTMQMELDYLNLAGVYAPNIVFTQCSLAFASFDRATLINAKFSSITMTNASFYAIVGSHLTMSDVLFFGNDFRDSKLSGIRLTRVATMGTIDLTNADLYDNTTKFDPHTLEMMLSSPLVIIQNARLVDGSYGPINSSNQLPVGDVEEECVNGSQLLNRSRREHEMVMEIVPIQHLPALVNRTQFGRCAFVARKLGRATIEHEVRLASFSVLIDSNVAAYQLTATLGCYGSHKSSINVGIHFYKENHLWIHGYQTLNTTEVPQTTSLSDRIPPETRIFTIEIESNIADPNGFCLADHLKMNIVRN